MGAELVALRGELAVEQPPSRFIGGADALARAEGKLAERQGQIDAFRGLVLARAR